MPPATNPLSKTSTYYGQSWNGTTACTAYPSGTYIYNTPCYSSTTNSAGKIVAQTQITYSDTGHPVTTQEWVSGSVPAVWLTSTSTYNGNGTVATSHDVNGAFYQYGYTGTGGCNGLLLTSVTYPLTSVGSSSQAWDCNGGVITSSTDPNGNKTTLSYNDPLYRQTSVGYPDGGSTTTTYNTGGSLPWSTRVTTLVVGTTSTSTTNTLDGLARPVQASTTDPQSSTGYNNVNTTYNTMGQVYSVTNPFFTTSDPTYGLTYYVYDGLERLNKTTNPDTTYRTVTYSGRATETVDEAGITKINQIDGLGRTVSVCQVTSATQANGTVPVACGQDIAGTGFLASYGYDALGNRTSVSQSGQGRTFTFDGLSRLMQATNPESGTVNYTYDTSGQQGDLYTRVAPQANQTGSATTTTTYSYDSMHRLLGKTYSDGTAPVSYAYDAATELGASLVNTKGRIVYGVSNNSASAFSYDTMGRTANIWSCTPYNCGTGTYEIGSTFDYVGDMLTFTDSNTFTNRSTPVTFTYSYDEDSRLTGMSSSYTGTKYPATLFTVNTINALGASTVSTLGNGVMRTSGYDTRERLTSSADTNGSKTTYSYLLGYFANSTINTVTDSLEGTWTYGYDSFNRLSNASETSQAFSYQYDQFGNRWGTNSACSSSDLAACQFTFNANNQITNAGITYDAAGNITFDGTYSYTHDAEGRTTTATGSSGQVGAYDYDAFGQRTHESIGGTNYEFIFDPAGRAYEELVGETFKQTELYAGGTHVGVYANNTTYFSHANWVGTEVRHTLPTGANTSTCTDYLPFGDGADCTGDIQTWNQPQFTGQWTDYETSGNVHMANRNYLAIEGRFSTPDPAGAAAAEPSDPQTWNLYAYVGNNPLIHIDPTGLDCIYVDPDGKTTTTKQGDCFSDTDDGFYFDGAVYGGSATVLPNGDVLAWVIGSGVQCSGDCPVPSITVNGGLPSMVGLLSPPTSQPTSPQTPTVSQWVPKVHRRPSATMTNTQWDAICDLKADQVGGFESDEPHVPEYGVSVYTAQQAGVSKDPTMNPSTTSVGAGAQAGGTGAAMVIARETARANCKAAYH